MASYDSLQVEFENLTPEWCLRAAEAGLRLQLALDAILAQDEADRGTVHHYAA